MFLSEEDLAIGDWVDLTAEGAKAHRKYHGKKVLAGGALFGAVALPLALPGGFLASVGIVGGGVGVAAGGAAQAAAGAAGGAGFASFAKDYLDKHPEAKAIGIIVDKRKRRLGQDGYDYSVTWSDGKASRHLGIHLRQVVPPLPGA